MSREVLLIKRIAQAIYFLRAQRVMLGQALASLYGVTVGALTQAVKRNANRFPNGFVFQLTPEEFTNLKSQIVISSWGGLRSRPYAFTEQGVLAQKFSELEQRVGKHDDEIAAIIDAIRQLIALPSKLRREIGFHVRESSPRYRTRTRR